MTAAGTGRPNCRTAIALVEPIAQARGVPVTPGVVIDGTVAHAGGMPSRHKIEGWLAT